MKELRVETSFTQVAMYRLSSSAGGYKLEVVSLGLYSLEGRVDDIVACHDSIWGQHYIPSYQLLLNFP